MAWRAASAHGIGVVINAVISSLACLIGVLLFASKASRVGSISIFSMSRAAMARQIKKQCLLTPWRPNFAASAAQQDDGQSSSVISLTATETYAIASTVGSRAAWFHDVWREALNRATSSKLGAGRRAPAYLAQQKPPSRHRRRGSGGVDQLGAAMG